MLKSPSKYKGNRSAFTFSILLSSFFSEIMYVIIRIKIRVLTIVDKLLARAKKLIQLKCFLCKHYLD